ncbi:hypothetical protein BCV72DRAFT_339400 [Rhizopus microsporus var. microsporus]|uniref:Nucleoporin-domain-containing protein n=2 Tax=Rhizopus microsporus TaxID=58291 RepID=A0A2G4SJB4_RHIZD|nr:uncharacterized protein RHIMIDRAFT_267038 [Rhizopus microsporus ATCC 52813]ORE01474.1 hypothetical protein BCV72DRAFT_339400 [Rhizopus microsporus var. microsporus]PHZ08855.1 hypothetical protein RHIMIDRAFT_267038 [Rhizopus microsporus ATCC 52813]
METSCLEKSFNAIEEASVTLESRSIIDRQFPDLTQTFSNHFVYEKTTDTKVKPTALKNSVNMPIIGIEGINQLKPDSPSGIAPKINKAYFAVGKCLYLWDYVNSNNISIYEEEDDIIGIGFAPPKPDVFNSEKICQLLIVSTLSFVKIIAISEHPTDGVRFHKTDMYTSTSGVNMKTILGTNNGRIFMLGNDGNVWELDYRQSEGWFTGKCSKRLHSPGLFSALFLSMNDPVIQLTVDETGRILYQLTAHSHIIITYLGKSGQGYQPIITYTKSQETARLMCPSLSSLDNFRIASIHPVSPYESRAYQLVAVTSSGHRLYYSYHKQGSNLKTEGIPSDLTLIHVRSPPSMIPGQISKALYKDGVMTLVYNNEQKQSIFTISPDLGKLTKSTAVGRPELVEFVDETTVPGSIIAIAESHCAEYQLNELSAHYTAPTRQLLVLTTCGLCVLAKQRPIDMLFGLVSGTYEDAAMRINHFREFLTHFGYSNSCAMSLGLVTSYNSNLYKTNSSASATSQIITTVTALLQELSGIPSDLSLHEQQYTSRHDGLALFLYRTIRSVWDKPFFSEVFIDGKLAYVNATKKTDLLDIQTILRNLIVFMQSYPTLFPKANVNAEEKSIKNMYELAVYVAEAIAFFVYLIDTGDIAFITQNLKAEFKEHLKTVSLRQLLTTSGRPLVRELTGSLIECTFRRQNYDTEYVISILQQNCGTFCDASVVLLHRATYDIYSARSAPSSQTKAILNNALNILQRIAGQIPASSLAEISKEFASQNYSVYGINIALTCAKARDPNNATNGLLKTGYTPNEATAELFKAKQPFYDVVFDLLLDVTNRVPDCTFNDLKKNAYAAAFNSQDIAFHYYIYEKFMNNGIDGELIKTSPAYLEEFLSRQPYSYKRLRLLAKYYKEHEEFEKAANVYIQLAQSQEVTNEERSQYLANASICARSVTAPAKQYEKYHLLQTVNQLDPTQNQ